ncbi:MAG: glycerophosphodiester phosphodiesterase family protein [Candidatus Borkfalkiaceae bacterium]|nr:glycerophosphodiester phosphodiesterase family protein [Christensenellaceae bacterium]
MKGVFAVEWIREVVEITRKAEQLENAVFIAFDAENLLALRKLLPKQPLQLLTCEWRDDLPDFLAKNHFGLDIAYNQLTEERISACHTKGVQVNCWTVDDKSAAEALYAMGVDYITSNILE